ncbi:MAG: hypothetical protein IPJ61_05250 [Tessaracoccus sp.]|uniref:hypothetical protein n=1 Tax=Tessaracoccus sp. TaxID=1971211 RepID=UPI001EB832CF|nr:hypothetical protein [Tessaracoccus sp.]MBK7820483.1 hypothetical protein [Tessaracoccus sp.]
MLDRYARRLHETNAAGLSMYSSETQRLAFNGASEPEIAVPERLVQPGNEAAIDELRRVMRLLPEVADPASPSPNAPWGFVGADAPEQIDIAAVGSAVRAIDDAARNAPPSTAFGRAVRTVRRPAEARLLQRLIHARPPLTLLDEARTERWRSAIQGIETALTQFQSGALPALSPATPSILDLPLGDILARAQAAARSSFWGRKKRQLAVIEEFKGSVAGVGIDRKEAVTHLTRWLGIQQHMRSLVAQANAVPGISLPTDWNVLAGEGLTHLTQQAAWLQEMADAVDPTTDDGALTGALRDLLAVPAAPDPASMARLDAFAVALGSCPASLERAQRPLRHGQARRDSFRGGWPRPPVASHWTRSCDRWSAG